MATDAKKTVTHAAVYGLGNISRNIVSVLMLPIYTRFLTTADYGVIELLSMLLDFVSIILGARLGQGIFRFYSDAVTQKEKDAVISSAFFLAVSFNGTGVVFLILFAEPLAQFLLGDGAFGRYVSLFALTLALSACMEVGMTFIRAQQKPWLYVWLSVVKLLLQVGLNIYFVVILRLHVEGVIYSALISSGVMALVLTSYTLSKVGIRFSYDTARRLLGFSLPLMLAAIGAFYLTFGDRYFLRVYWGLSEVGIYSLSYKFGFMLAILAWNPFEMIWDTQKYEIYRKANARQIYQSTFLVVSSFMVFMALALSLFAKDILFIMSDPAFHSAYKLVPIILVAYIVQAWTGYCNFGILIKRNTLQITYAAVIAVAVITIAYLTLIPLFGGYGAAWATVLAFLVRFLWINWKATQAYDMQLPWGKVMLLSGLAIFVYLLSIFSPEPLLGSIVVRLFLALLFFSAFMVLPILPASEKATIMNILRDPRKIRNAFS